jgi:hypothetical protein
VVYGAALGGGMTLSLGTGFVARGDYTFLEDLGEFEPANEISFSAGIDVRGGSAVLGRFDATLRLFEQDRLQGVEIYEEGNQLDLSASLNARRTGLAGLVSARVILKADDTLFQEAGQLVSGTKQSPGTGAFLRVAVDAPLVRRVRAGTAFEWDHYSGSDAILEDGNLLGAGPIVELGLARQLRLRVAALYSTGTLDGTGGEPDRDVERMSAYTTLDWRAAP